MTIVAGAEEILEDSGIERLVHRNGEDILHRVLIVDGEIVDDDNIL